MLLVEFTINSVLNRLSQEGIALTHWWKNKIMNFDPPQCRLAKNHGGYIGLGFGSIDFFPDLFNSDWPPPINGDITIKYTPSTEASAETLFTGIAHRSNINRERIKYDLYGPEFTSTTAGGTAFNDTLVNVMTTLCGAGHLNLTLNSSAARSPSPNVLHTVSGSQLDISLASAICAFYTHCFYIVGSTLYLVDMLGDNGTQTITEFEFFPGDYDDLDPVSMVRAGSFSRTSSYPYGREISETLYHDTQANAETCLDNIITVLHKPRARLKMPLLGSLPVPGEKISWTDTALAVDTDMYIRARTMQYDFVNEEITIEGEGVIAAA